MTELPSYAALAGVDPRTLNALLDNLGTPAWSATYDHEWERDRATWQMVERALTLATDPMSATAAGAKPPRWLDPLVGRRLRRMSTTSWAGNGFVLVRLLERLGLVVLDHDDTYVLALVSGCGPDRAAQLREDPDLVEHAFWRVFEVEGGGEVSLTNIDRFSSATTWRECFLELVDDGTLDRERVLTSCLEALQRDFSAYRVGWYSGTYRALEPTNDEIASHQGAYRNLLRSDIPATATFAMHFLTRVHKSGALDADETLGVLHAAAISRTKATALQAIALARALADGDDRHRAAAIDLCRRALAHGHSDVQRSAAALLEQYDERSVVAASSELLSPGVRHETGLGVLQVEPATRPSQPMTAVPPPTTRDDLVERLASLLEDAGDPAELEAVLAGLATLDDPTVLAPLTKRAAAVEKRGPRTDLGDTWLPGQLARVVLSGVGSPGPGAEPTLAPRRFIVRRLDEVAESLRGAAPRRPLLATPDLPGGWVSPDTLVSRLRSQHAPRHHDLVAALLRLHPEGRRAALTQDLPPAVRRALGAPGKPKGPAAWWRAAERSRAAYDAAEAPRRVAELQTFTWTDARGERTGRYWRFLPLLPEGRRARDDEPTEVGAADLEVELGPLRTAFGIWPQLGDWVPALATIWPHDAEHFLLLTCSSVLDAAGSTEVAHDCVRVLDALARHPGRLGSQAHLVLAAGLAAGKAEQRVHAVDAFQDLVPTGRLSPADLARTMAAHAEGWTASRWAGSLRSAAQAPSAKPAVLDLLTALLPQLPPGTQGLSSFLDLLLDETLTLGRRTTDPVLRAWLESLTGTSRAARAARDLLAI